MRALARMAARQHGLLSNRQIQETFASRSAPKRLQSAGLVERRGHRVYALCGSLPSWEADILALCLATDRLVVASHRSALRLWGMRSVDDEVEVSIRYPGSLSVAGAVVHRIRDLTQHDFTYIDAVPVTTPARTLCDAGLVFPDAEVERLAQHALAKEIVTPDELWRFRRRVGRQGRNGVGVLDRVLRRLPPDVSCADSGPEIEMASLCRRFGLPEPAWQHRVVASGEQYVIDFAYPEQRLAIEYDEFLEHTRPETFARDRERQNNLHASGWTVLRFIWSDLRERPADVAHRIRRFLGSVS